MFHREEESTLPDWFWFFLAIPLGLILVLLYRKRDQIPALQRLAERANPGRPLYREPDSIPLEMHPSTVSFSEMVAPREAELADTRDEDIAMEIMASEYGTAQPESAAIVGGATSAEEAGSIQQPEEQPTPDQPDDLKVIEGIGPAIASILGGKGIQTFRQLAGTPVEQLVEILEQARLGHLADPETWPEQARLAAEKQWDELIAFQRTLKAGRRTNQA